MESSDIKRLRGLEAENQRLKRMYAELSLEHQILNDALGEQPPVAFALTAGG